MTGLFDSVLRAVGLAFAMTWEVTWALILGFALSAVVQAVVSKSRMSQLLPADSPHSITVASLLGAASSSCSYAAVALGAFTLPEGRELHGRDRLRSRDDGRRKHKAQATRHRQHTTASSSLQN